MFIKKINKTNLQGNEYTYYRLCESVRIGSKTRHNNLLNLGTLSGLGEEDMKPLANRIEELYLGIPTIFVDTSPQVEVLAVQFYKELRAKKQQEKLGTAQLSTQAPTQKAAQTSSKAAQTPSKAAQTSGLCTSPSPDLELVNIDSIKHDEVREIGGESLCLQALEELGLPALLSLKNIDPQTSKRAIALIISRAVYPASEHKTSQWIASNSAVTELIFGEHHDISHHQLYKAGDILYAHKEAIEALLSTKTNELFDLSDKIVFYDLTNTYFEGRKQGSVLSQFGRSKEKRSDAKLVSLALVVNAEGFVKYSKIYEGNIFEAYTLLATVEALSINASTQKPVIVMDAGIATAENLTMLKEKGYDYLCVTRSKLKDYTVGQTALEVTDNKENKIQLTRVTKEGCDDQYLHVRSEMKAVKEASMEANYSVRFEKELDQLAKSAQTKGGTKNITKVYERLGRIKERYPSANKHYDIDIQEENQIAVLITYSRKPLPPVKQTHGVYFLRTTLKTADEAKIWLIYNTLTEIEATFRTLKTDLSLRPIYHKNDERTKAHIFLGIIAYMVVNTIRHKLKLQKIQHDWPNIVRIMGTQKLVTTSMTNEKEQVIIIKKMSEPNSQVMKIYQATKYKQMIMKTKKYVLPHDG